MTSEGADHGGASREPRLWESPDRRSQTIRGTHGRRPPRQRRLQEPGRSSDHSTRFPESPGTHQRVPRPSGHHDGGFQTAPAPEVTTRLSDYAGLRHHHDRAFQTFPALRDLESHVGYARSTVDVEAGKEGPDAAKCPPLEGEDHGRDGLGRGLVAADERQGSSAVGKRGERRLTDRRCAV
jgi:hypothetical protein